MYTVHIIVKTIIKIIDFKLFGHCRWKLLSVNFINLLDLTRNRSEKCNFRSLAGIDPAALAICFIDFHQAWLIPGDAPFNIDDNHEITIDDNDDSSS